MKIDSKIDKYKTNTHTEVKGIRLIVKDVF